MFKVYKPQGETRGIRFPPEGAQIADKEQILKLIPHRPPFLWIDSIVELEAGVRCVALKFVDPAGLYLQGIFPAMHPAGSHPHRGDGADSGSHDGRPQP